MVFRIPRGAPRPVAGPSCKGAGSSSIASDRVRIRPSVIEPLARPEISFAQRLSRRDNARLSASFAEGTPVLETSPSLLEQLRAGPQEEAWRKLVGLYAPMLYGWIHRYSIQSSDADDLVQEVLSTLVRELPQFQYDPERGSFRSWIRTILANRIKEFFRARQSLAQPAGGSGGPMHLDQLADPNSDLSRVWNEEHDRHVAHTLLNVIRTDFEPKTWHAFERTTLHGAKAADVATELGMSANAVFIAKSRVLRRLRREMQEISK
jgi:RNA polymerase sigma-70 factor (ECF subfamily)